MGDGFPRWRAAVAVATIAAVGLVARAEPAAASQFFIDCDSGDDLQATIDAASSGDVIVATGTCRGLFRVDGKDLSILGFFSVTLDGERASSAFPVLLIDGGAHVVLENAEVTGGLGSFNSHSAGIDVYRGSLELRNSRVHGNNSEAGGGVLVFSGASAVIEDSEIVDNISQGLGGGIFSNGALTIRDTVVADNHAIFASAGGIYNNVDGVLTLVDSTVSGNDVAAFAGGILNRGWARLVRVGVLGNEGGIRNEGDLIMRHSAITGNDAGTRETFSLGGGITNTADGTVDIRTSTIGANEALIGGGIHNLGEATLEAVTLSGNVVSPASRGAHAGGVYNDGVLEVTSSVLSGNASPDGDCVTDTPLVSNGYNHLATDCEVGAAGTGDVFGDDPRLDAPADNGGDTPTMRPLAGSPVIDAGACLRDDTDQRNVHRPQNRRCDVGAYENLRPTQPGTPKLVAGDNPNAGDFTLEWSESTDADGDAVTYEVQRRDADDAAWWRIATTTATSLLRSGAAEGTVRHRVVATDGNHSRTSGAGEHVVIDRTAPAAPGIAADRAPEHVDSHARQWFADRVTVTVTPGLDPLLSDGSPGTGTVGEPEEVVHSTPGEHVATAESTDVVGNVSSTASLTTWVDVGDPAITIDCPATVLIDEVVAVPWSASDGGVGLDGPSSGDLVLPTGQVGPASAKVEVADLVGHVGSATCDYAVVYDFGGFDAPLASTDEPNHVAAGRSIAVRFGLGGDRGLDVLDGTPTWTPLSCATLDPIGDPVPTDERRPFEYSERRDVFTYWWATDRAQRRTCVRFELRLDDGTAHTADVAFR